MMRALHILGGGPPGRAKSKCGNAGEKCQWAKAKGMRGRFKPYVLREVGRARPCSVQWQDVATMPPSGKQVFLESEVEYRTVQGSNLGHWY